jgi:hypothetical protein
MSKEYVEMPFPYVSKSKIKDLDYCKFMFYDDRILGNKSIDRDESVEGTNLHMVFHSFYEYLNPEDVFKDEFTDPRTPLEKHPFRKFIYERSMEYIRPDQRGYGKYKNVLRNFSSIECDRWLRINSLLHDKREIFDVFKPYALEKTFVNENLKLYGTIDRINIEIMPDKSKKIAIYDNKTGKVPKDVREHRESPNMFDWKLPSHYMKEIHFYGLLYLTFVGWQLMPEVIDFLNSEDWWFVKKDGMNYKEVIKYKMDYLTELQNNYRLYKTGKVFSSDDIIIGFYFMNGDKGYRPIKNYSYSSHKSVLLAINEYRSIMKNNYFVTNPKFVYNEIGCEKKGCSKLDKCKEMLGKS